MNDRNRLARRQVQFNADSRVAWQPMSAHRQRVTSLLCESAGAAPGRLCVLGAGNCNDLDLQRLAESFAEVHLVDLDGDALTEATSRQSGDHAESIVLHAECDVTGVWDLIAAWSPSDPAENSAVDRVLSAAERGCLTKLPGPFDVAASVCLLSQLTDAIVCTLGEKHPRFLDLLRVIRSRHIQMLAELVAPGGTGLLITDVVSSTAASEIASVSTAQLPALLTRLIESRNFFHGLNPSVLADLIKNDPVISPLLASFDFLEPWIWDFGVRQYAVVAIRFQRAGSMES